MEGNGEEAVGAVAALVKELQEAQQQWGIWWKKYHDLTKGEPQEKRWQNVMPALIPGYRRKMFASTGEIFHWNSREAWRRASSSREGWRDAEGELESSP